LECESTWQTRCAATQGYGWETGAACAAEALLEDTPTLMTPEHALHVVEIMAAARDSAKTGQRMDLQSKFKWPV
jgi:predicted dehydrogenase